MRAQLEVEGVANRHLLLRGIDQMARQIQQLLMLAEASEGHTYTLAVVDIAQIARSAIERFVHLAYARAVSLDLDVSGPSMVAADAGATFVLVRKLLENEIHHAPSGTGVRTKVEPGALVVRDAGPGIAPVALPQLFERFWRGEYRRDQGAGLGLSICLEIATRHGWSIAAGNRDPGAEFAVTLANSQVSACISSGSNSRWFT